MIDAETGVAREGVPEIFPECVNPLAGVQSAQGISPPLLDQISIGLTHLGTEQRVIDPALRRVDIEIRRHDVVIAREHDRLA